MASKSEKIHQASIASKKNFDLEKFKNSKLLKGNVKFKDQEWIPCSPAFQEVLGIPGIPKGQVTILRGHTDTGKTTTLLECAKSCQELGILPVFIITEMKWNWEHAREMGIQFKEVCNDQGEVEDYEGFFIYVDRETLNTIEEVAAFILDMLNDQKTGKLPYELCFLWDSIGSVPCELSVRSNKNNNEWNAGAMSTQFANNVNQKIVLSRKESQPYTNTLVCINKVWNSKPETPMEQTRMMNKGGTAMGYDAAMVIDYGKTAQSGTNTLQILAKKKRITYGKRTKIKCSKNHVTQVTMSGNLIMTSQGFLKDDPLVLKKYQDSKKEEWTAAFGTADYSLEEVFETESSSDE